MIRPLLLLLLWGTVLADQRVGETRRIMPPEGATIIDLTGRTVIPGSS
ncbi:MAG TPA: hypothetical protein VE379_10365 [Vicinamibacterales bacterium]|jgi:hypothetical protein|nr:hypothetical protein [Vicinamibacterales bacterium]